MSVSPAPQTLSVMIVDDEAPARARLRDLLADIAAEVPNALVAEAANGQLAVEALKERVPDVMLVDIRMPKMDGIELARHVARLDRPPSVIFVTAYDDFAVQAFELNAIDYLVKPVRSERLAAALERVRTFAAGREHGVSASGQRRTHLCARIRGSLRLIPIEDVHYLQAEEKYVVVHHARGEDLIEESLKSLEEEFGERFVRIHRNCLVARHEIVELKRAPDGHVQAVLRHGQAPLEVSRRCVSALRETVRHL